MWASKSGDSLNQSRKKSWVQIPEPFSSNNRFDISFQSLSIVVIATMAIILVTSVSGMSMMIPTHVDSQVFNDGDDYKRFKRNKLTSF